MKKFRLGVAILLSGLVIFVIVQVMPEDETTYQGEPLVYWIHRDLRNGGNDNQLQTALSNLGTNAIPPLMRMLTARDGVLKKMLVRLLDRMPRKPVSLTQDIELHYYAIYGFAMLGPLANSAVPGLVKVYQDNPSTDIRCSAALCLGYIGPTATEALPALLEGVTNRSLDVAAGSIRALGEIHADPATVVPVLAKSLQNTNDEIRHFAFSGLAQYGPDTPGVTAAFVDQLGSSEYQQRMAAVQALWEVETNRAVLATMIGRMTNDPDPDVQAATAQALGSVYPARRESWPRKRVY